MGWGVIVVRGRQVPQTSVMFTSKRPSNATYDIFRIQRRIHHLNAARAGPLYFEDGFGNSRRSDEGCVCRVKDDNRALRCHNTNQPKRRAARSVIILCGIWTYSPYHTRKLTARLPWGDSRRTPRACHIVFDVQNKGRYSS